MSHHIFHIFRENMLFKLFAQEINWSWAWWSITAISLLKTQRQEDCNWSSMLDKVRPFLKNKMLNKKARAVAQGEEPSMMEDLASISSVKEK
jgi:hypothetical protein